MESLGSANLGLRFLLELAALAAVAWWGQEELGWWAAVVLPLALAAFWGSFLSPKARWTIPVRLRLALELVVFGSASAAYYDAGGAGVAIGFAAAVAVSELVTWTWPR